MKPLSVTQFIEVINEVLASLDLVTVEGEVEDFKVIQGKWVVFILKDKESSVNCFMPIWKYRTQIEDGMLVKAIGQPKLRNKGFFSFTLESVEPTGEGALKRAFELLKQKLEQEGLFAPERKRVLPRFPEHLALITSRDAAAYGDFLKVLKARLGGLRISFLHTAVQGQDAPDHIVEALTQANTDLAGVDAIVLIRGGGSMEDLQAFNDEFVVRAVASSRTPIIVGIGHERDVCLAELAADIRASTPSNAAELVVRSKQELSAMIHQQTVHLHHRLRNQIAEQQDKITHSVTVLRGEAHATGERLRTLATRIEHVHRHIRELLLSRNHHVKTSQTAMSHHVESLLFKKKQALGHLLRLLQSFSPDNVVKRGFSITRTSDGSILKHPHDTHPGDTILTTLAGGVLTTEVPGKRKQLELGL